MIQILYFNTVRVPKKLNVLYEFVVAVLNGDELVLQPMEFGCDMEADICYCTLVILCYLTLDIGTRNQIL
jgi:hypothetical protein